MKASDIPIDTSSYSSLHGKPPRGRGYWAFGIDGQDETFHVGGFPYALAARLAQREAKIHEWGSLTLLAKSYPYISRTHARPERRGLGR